MRTWLIGAVLVAACGSREVVSLDNDVQTEEAIELPAEPKTWTICADEIAMELDPTIDSALQDALAFWADDPAAGTLRWSDTGECDVPVFFSDEDRWKGTQGARANVRGKMRPGLCTPKNMELRESEWDRVTANDWTFVVLAHEVGHLLCHPHEDVGIMSPNGGLD